MKNQLAALELRVLVSELGQLVGSRLGQVYDLDTASGVKGKALILQFSAGSEGQRFLACVAPFSAFFSLRKPPASEGPGGFCSFLRQRLGNARLASLRQLGSERILELVFSSGSGQLMLVVELFSKGNVILADDKGIILGCAEQQHWKDRFVRPGFAYTPPPPTADFAAMNEEQFRKSVLSSEKDSVVKALAVGIGLSGTYAEELCAVAAVDKSSLPGRLSQPELGRLYSSLQQLLSRKPEPIGVLEGSSVVEAFPFRIAAVAAAQLRPFSSFNEAVEAVMLRQLSAASLSSKTALHSRQVREMEIAVERQKAAVSELEAAAAESASAAEAIYVHYLDVKQVLNDYNRLRKTFTSDQLREYFKSNRKVISIDEKTGAITLELG